MYRDQEKKYQEEIAELKKHNDDYIGLFQILINNTTNLLVKIDDYSDEFDKANTDERSKVSSLNYGSVIKDVSNFLREGIFAAESKTPNNDGTFDITVNVTESSTAMKVAVILDSFLDTNEKCKKSGISFDKHMDNILGSQEFIEQARKFKINLKEIDDAMKKKVKKVTNRNSKGGATPTPQS